MLTCPINMAPGSSLLRPHKAMMDADGGGRREDSQEAGTLGPLSEVNVNRMSQNDVNQPLSNALFPPKKRHHHLANQNIPECAASLRNAHMDCKENKSENSRGGTLTSRISSLSPGTKRKMLGYSADGSIPPLPPRQKRLKQATKLTSGEGKLCTKFARAAEPSGLFGDLKPGIMRQQTRTRSVIHALLSAVVGDIQRSLSAVDGLCYDAQAEMEEPLTESCSDLSRWSDQPTETSLYGNIDLPDQSLITEKNDEVDGCSEIELRPRLGLFSTTESACDFVPFRRNGLHAFSWNLPTSPAHIPVVDPRDATGHHLQAPMPVTMKQEQDTTSDSSRRACIGEAFEFKQEEFEDKCDSLLGDGGGPLRHEDAIMSQQQELKSSDSGTNVATCWLELLSLDVQGRLAALRRSKRRVEAVIDSREQDLDAPLLPGCATEPTTSIQHADGQPIVDSWRKVFESMDRALTLEGQKLKSWLRQIHVMQDECQKDMISSSSLRSASFSEPPPPLAQDVQQMDVS